jgi:hypothetical protein
MSGGIRGKNGHRSPVFQREVFRNWTAIRKENERRESRMNQLGKDIRERYLAALPPELAKYPYLLRHHVDIERQAHGMANWPSASGKGRIGNRLTTSPSSEDLVLLEQLAQLDTPDAELVRLEALLPCPFCSPFNLPLDTEIC